MNATNMLLFNKPYGVICQFSPEGNHRTLKDFINVPNVYPAGRLDTDSEGLVVLTDNGKLQARISDPRYKLSKTYWVQVDGIPSETALAELRSGIDLGEFITQASEAKVIDEPIGLWPRTPPIRVRKAIPTTWLEIKIKEGKNRQVRRMTAKIGHPTLRLIRYAVGDWTIQNLEIGTWKEIYVV